MAIFKNITEWLRNLIKSFFGSTKTVTVTSKDNSTSLYVETIGRDLYVGQTNDQDNCRK